MSAGALRRDWDATSYDRVSDPQLQWAREQLSRVTLRGGEVVLDAGCGSGRVTALLADLVQPDGPGAAPEGDAGCRGGRRTGGRVYGVDLAPAMVRFARDALGPRATVLCQDLVELELPERVDLIFSNATFHWIANHDALFAALFRTLAPGGKLVAQCGGRGNIDEFRRAADEVATGNPAFAEYFDGWQGPWNYAGAAETAERLKRAGFVEVSCWLEPKSVALDDPRAFVGTVCLVRHLDRLPDALRGQFIDAVLEQLDDSRAVRFSEAGSRAGGKREGEPLVLEYVRLNMTARRA